MRMAWAMAILLTLVSAGWQRLSGPTHPVSVDAGFGNGRIEGTLLRTHSIDADQPVRVRTSVGDARGAIRWRRYPSSDPWRETDMVRHGEDLEGVLPRQPAAGKIEYQVVVRRGDETLALPARPAITRFKGNVSPWLLLPHIACMFLALLFSARAGFGAWAGVPASPWTGLALAMWVVGGLVLGPGVQKQAFDAYWTGVPFGTDLTDNKTLIAVVAWAWAVWRGRGGRVGRTAIIGAMLLTFVVFAIPHSTWGSEVDWDRVGGQ